MRLPLFQQHVVYLQQQNAVTHELCGGGEPTSKKKSWQLVFIFVFLNFYSKAKPAQVSRNKLLNIIDSVFEDVDLLDLCMLYFNDNQLTSQLADFCLKNTKRSRSLQ